MNVARSSELLGTAPPPSNVLDAIIGSHPPRPRLSLNVGITGHRAAGLSDRAIMSLEPIVSEVLLQIRDATLRVHLASRDIFSPVSPKLQLHSALATGADQLAASSARQQGYKVRALLPFAPEVYLDDFDKGAEQCELRQQLQAADEYFALPCERSDGHVAYVQVGKALVAAADIVIAIWDGQAGNGPGGTAHVVELALRSGTPIVHILVDREAGTAAPGRLLVGSDVLDPTSQPLDTSDEYFALVNDTLTPRTALEREHLAAYFNESEKTSNWRIEYPMLLAVLGLGSGGIL